MATLSLSSAGGVVYWTISGLTSDSYLDSGIACVAATGTTTPPSGIVDSTGPFTNTGSKSGSFQYAAGRYTFYAYAKTYDGKYWPAGIGTVSVAATSIAWDVPKTVGSHEITAAEWNRLIAFIISKRGSFTVTYGVAGQSLSAAMYNQLIDGMSADSGYRVSRMQAITAARLNLLVTLANNL